MDKEQLKKLKEIIREKRKEKGYSQETMAEMLGISLPGYKLVETGESDIKLTVFSKIIDVLELDFSIFQGSLPLRKEDDETSDFFNKLALLQQASNEGMLKKIEDMLDRKLEKYFGKDKSSDNQERTQQSDNEAEQI
ncbi:MAG: helix-turn-helix transcriptional regulator [Bacteroidia bacterium]|nr:helix-turn-helix transcriptional regulator [Bacteroidia bacterium]